MTIRDLIHQSREIGEPHPVVGTAVVLAFWVMFGVAGVMVG